MTDTMRAAQNDLAFMREVAEDRGPLPGLLGAHLFWAGAPFGLNVIYAWAGFAGFLPWPQEWIIWSWAPAAAVYVPAVIWLSLQGRRTPVGPGVRAFAAAWSAVGLMTAAVVAVVTVANLRTGIPFAALWPSLALVLYAGAWLVMGVLLRRRWALLVAGGCCATAIACAFLIGTNEHWLAMGIGLLLFMAAPGAAMMRRKKSV